jgi:hypothetical protein
MAAELRDGVAAVIGDEVVGDKVMDTGFVVALRGIGVEL